MVMDTYSSTYLRAPMMPNLGKILSVSKPENVLYSRMAHRDSTSAENQCKEHAIS